MIRTKRVIHISWSTFQSQLVNLCTFTTTTARLCRRCHQQHGSFDHYHELAMTNSNSSCNHRHQVLIYSLSLIFQFVKMFFFISGGNFNQNISPNTYSSQISVKNSQMRLPSINVANKRKSEQSNNPTKSPKVTVLQYGNLPSFQQVTARNHNAADKQKTIKQIIKSL